MVLLMLKGWKDEKVPGKSATSKLSKKLYDNIGPYFWTCVPNKNTTAKNVK